MQIVNNFDSNTGSAIKLTECGKQGLGREFIA
jgi:hypothetical protein